MNTKKILCLLFLFPLLSSCAPIFVPQSSMPAGTFELPATQSPLPNVTATYTATFTPTSFPPGFTPSPIPTPTFPEGSCHQGPIEQLEFGLPAPSDLKWETIDNFQRLTGLTGPVHFAYPSPDGRWWVIEFVSRRDSTQYELASEEALYVLSRQPTNEENILLLADSATTPAEIAQTQRRLEAIEALAEEN